MFSRVFFMFVGGFGAVCLSQAPEFSQHYQQRIGGAVDELNAVVSDFDADARRSELSRSQALETMASDEDGLIRDRGVSMAKTIRRRDELEVQAFELSQSPGVLKPLVVAMSPDPLVVDGAWEDFAPAVPVTVSGAVYAGFGFLLGLLIAWPIVGALRRMFRRRRPRTEPDFT